MPCFAGLVTRRGQSAARTGSLRRRRCLDPFVKHTKTIKKYWQLILNAVAHGLSNSRFEVTNTHIWLFTRRAYGYHSPESLAMAGLTCGGSAHRSPVDHENLRKHQWPHSSSADDRP